MKYCVDFAFANRQLILKRVQEVFVDYFPEINFMKLLILLTIMLNGKITWQRCGCTL